MNHGNTNFNLQIFSVKREVLWEKFVNERDLGLPQGRHCYDGDWSKMSKSPF